MMTAEALNRLIANDEIYEFIRVSEARQIKELSKIADAICAAGDVRLVLLAGASSAGKTTTSKRLCTQLRVNGREAVYLSTDDYFVGDARNPRDEKGELDYEHVDAVDTVQLTADIAALLRGESVGVRRFDFLKHAGYYEKGKNLTLTPHGMIVVEGIHALNPRLVAGLDAQTRPFRVYIDPKPDFEPLPGIVITSVEARFMRRLVRDNRYRRLKPSVTLHLWPKVLQGERRWIEPFRAGADAFFNSYLTYETSALKPYVGGLLEMALRETDSNPYLLRMRDIIAPVIPIDTTIVPGDSILRETIGGSQLEY